MAGAVEQSQGQQASGPGRSQFSLRGLLIQVSLSSIVLALLATQSGFIVLIPSVIVVSILIATGGRTLSGAMIGFYAGCFVAVPLVLPWYRYQGDFLDVQRLFLYASFCAWVGAGIDAIVRSYAAVGIVALGLATLVVILAIQFVILASSYN